MSVSPPQIRGRPFPKSVLTLGAVPRDPGPAPEDILTNIACPVLAVWGEKDPWTPVAKGSHPGTAFHNYCDDFELVTIRNCGHCPHDEAPEAVNALILPWMKGLDARRKQSE